MDRQPDNDTVLGVDVHDQPELFGDDHRHSATGAGVGGLQFTPPPTGGPSANQISNFEWLATTTNVAGQLSFVWNIDAVPPGGVFSAQDVDVVGDAPGTAPPTYGAPAGTGGQLMLVSGASEVLGTGFGGLAAAPTVPTGTISITKAVNDPAYYGAGGAVFQIRDGFGDVLDTLVTDDNGHAGPSIPLTAAAGGIDYAVVEVTAPPGYQLAPPMVVTVDPQSNTVASFTGADTELAVPAALGAAKVDATTGDPVAGAVFDFRYDSADNGVYDQDLGSCTTSGAGTCQPPTQNTAGGWLPGWYQVTETAAPPGYWLDPATAVQTVFLAPGATATASVTLADRLLGSLSLTKTGNDTAYWSVAGAVFTVTGPAPSTAVVGALTVATTGSTNTLTGLVPGPYTLTETTVPPGYTAVAPFTVAVSAGRATTTTTAADAVQPGTLVISKTDAATAEALPGATFDIRYDPTGSGTYGVDLGSCTTDTSGTCSPAANDGPGFLPGNYEVVETAAPPGYDRPTPAPTDHVTVDPAGTTTAAFADALLVPASFTKVATGSINATQLVLAGAVIDVTAGTTFGGTPVASCTTDAHGHCTTAATLISGQPYCWSETTAPPGLAGGATGCFVADNALGAQPITVTDAGEFVAIAVKKVDAADPTTTLPGAVFDLYRQDGGTGPNAPTPPADAPTETGQTWVAQATTGTTGVADFPLQLPGYVYCAVETQAPANYVLDPTEHCTTVLQGTTATPAPITMLTIGDAEASAVVAAHKFNSATPTTGIPARSTTSSSSGTARRRAHRRPRQPAWPPSPVTPGGPAERRRTPEISRSPCRPVTRGASTRCPRPPTTPSIPPSIAPPRSPRPLRRDIDGGPSGVAGPGRGLRPQVRLARSRDRRPRCHLRAVGQGARPPGWSAPANPDGNPVPAGDWYVGVATTDGQGDASWSVPAGYSWCMHEVSEPAGYQPDPSWHCTAVISTNTPPVAATMALPETPVPTPAQPPLPYTGSPAAWQAALGGAFLLSGGALLLAARRRKRPVPEAASVQRPSDRDR